MDYIIIEVPDMNDSVSTVVLSGKQYQIRFTYNDTGGYWSFGIYDTLGNPIRVGIKMVPKMPLNLFCGTDDMPNGVFGILSSLEKVGRNDFVDGKAKFIFAPV
jgi:hypothetical protein